MPLSRPRRPPNQPEHTPGRHSADHLRSNVPRRCPRGSTPRTPATPAPHAGAPAKPAPHAGRGPRSSPLRRPRGPNAAESVGPPPQPASPPDRAFARIRHPMVPEPPLRRPNTG
nr:vegetative cell wall protein gp1-like [Lolium perenne]